MTSETDEFGGCFFDDPFSPLINDSSSAIDILQAFQEHNYDNYTPLLASTSLTTKENFDSPFDQITSSPPVSQLENLSLINNQMGIISVTSSNESLDLDVKIEEGQLPLLYDTNNYDYYGGPHNNALKMMQRSYSSSSFQRGKPNGVLYDQPKQLGGFIESLNVHSEVLASLDHSFSSTHMRRASSTGDLHSPNVGSQTSQRLSSSPLATKSSSFMEEANFKVGRYNADERKEKILRYRAKRTQRNFNKTIKYACRKTLADNRPRIRGRFARNDEPGDQLPKSSTYNNRYRDEDELWMMEGFHEEISDEGIMTGGRGQFFSTTNYPSIAQFHHQFSFIQN